MSPSDEAERLRKQRRKRYRRKENLSLFGTLIAALLFICFWLAAIVLPLLLMVAAIHYLFTH